MIPVGHFFPMEGALSTKTTTAPSGVMPQVQAHGRSALHAFSGWMLVAAIIYAPWAFASRPYLLEYVLAALLLVAVSIWLMGLVWDRRWPRINGIPLGCVAFLVAMMWVGIWNAASDFEPQAGNLVPRHFWTWLPANVDPRTALPSAVCLTGILLGMMVIVDLASDAVWLQRLLATVGWTGFSVIVSGLVLKAGVLPKVTHLLEARPWANGDVFGPLDYHGNVASLICLTLPALAFIASRIRSVSGGLFMLAAFGLMLLGACVNISRTGLALTVVSAGVLGWYLARVWAQHHQGSIQGARTRRLFACATILLLASLAALCVAGQARSIARLRTLSAEVNNPWNARYLRDQEAWKMTLVRPWYGAGIGSYKLLIQQSTLAGQYLAGRFRPGAPYTVLNHQVQNDYLQAIVEWGWVGFAAWTALIGSALRSLYSFPRQSPGTRLLFAAIAVALGAVLLHALVDCPLQIPALQLYVAVFLAVALALGREHALRYVGPGM